MVSTEIPWGFAMERQWLRQGFAWRSAAALAHALSGAAVQRRVGGNRTWGSGSAVVIAPYYSCGEAVISTV